MTYLYRHIRLDKQEIFYIGIGSSKNYKRAYSKNNRNSYWHNIAKNGYEVEIMLDNLTWEEACEKEKGFIKLYGRKDLNEGTLVNMTDGGEGNNNLSPEINKIKGQKISNKKLGVSNIKLKGRKLSEETKQKIRDVNLGKKYSEEINKKKGLLGEKNSFFGKKHSIKTIALLKNKKLGTVLLESTKKKISDSLKGCNSGPQEIVSCPYCNKFGGVSNMKRYHFENCKNKKV